MIKAAVIGVGNMGHKYARLLQENRVEGMELCALTRMKEEYREILKPSIEKGVSVYESADALFEAAENGEEQIDAVIIATPHEAHETIAARAFQNHMHVLSDKPAGVYSRQARNMAEAAEENKLVFGMIFNQRTLPVYQALHDIVKSGEYGSLKKMIWTVTDWYRPESYYKGGSWRATWKGEGGGVLLNQCPHNLDLMQWILGMPERVQAFCREGHYHDIEVEDDVTAYLEWKNGASGTFITSTGDAPGISRLEIFLEEALVVCENGELKIAELMPELQMPEAEYRRHAADPFRKIRGTWKTLQFEKPEDPYQIILQGFADEIRGTGFCVAAGSEGRKSLMISNAMYLSSWEKRMVTIPQENSEEEKAFEKLFEMHLNKKRGITE